MFFWSTNPDTGVSTRSAADAARRPAARPRNRRVTAAAAVVTGLLLSGCYSLRWHEIDQPTAPPDAVAEHFAAGGGVLEIELFDPSDTYRYDPGEKDALHAKDPDLLRFRRAEIRLRDTMAAGTVIADLTFHDGAGSRLEIPGVDLLRLVPRLDTEGELQYPELLLEEFTRYSVVFRREHREFEMHVADPRAEEADRRTYRAILSNNCLDPTKWEIALRSADFSDFEQRLRSPLNLNQNRTLAHSWFYLDPALYETLLRVKNPQLAVDPGLLADYDGLSRRAEEVVIDFDRLRRPERTAEVELLELGHASKRPIEPLDGEQYYKLDYGLFVNRDEFETYEDLLQGTVKLASYEDRGFYNPDQPKAFSYDWVRPLEVVRIDQLAVEQAGTYVEITLDGPESPYLIRLGNVDLSHLDEQKLMTVAFGFNIYPLSRRHNPPQSTTRFDSDLTPDELKPYLLMVDKTTGRFVNHQLKGVDRLYLGWESLDRDVLELYLVSYERVIPVWMARVKVDDELVDRARVRRAFFG